MKKTYIMPAMKMRTLATESLMETMSINNDPDNKITDPGEILAPTNNLWDYEEAEEEDV